MLSLAGTLVAPEGAVVCLAVLELGRSRISWTLKPIVERLQLIDIGVGVMDTEESSTVAVEDSDMMVIDDQLDTRAHDNRPLVHYS